GALPTLSTIPVWTNDRNPGSSASSLYGPSGRFGSTYDPVSFVTAVRATFVPVCVTLTSTPGRTAPLASFTAPLIAAVPCAQPVAQFTVNINKPRATTIARRFIFHPEYCVTLKFLNLL